MRYLYIISLLLLIPSLVLATGQDLRVMTFNIWLGGTQVSLEKVVSAIEVSKADIVGIQEPGSSLERLAKSLGFYAHTGLNILSRYPLYEPPEARGDYVYVLHPQGVVVASNVHLRAYPYGPYDLRDGAGLEAVLKNEEHHLREIDSKLRRLTALADAGVPVFLVGDFNVPSHLDWTAAVAASSPQPFRREVPWPVSLALEAAGFRDSYREIYPDPLTHPGYTWTPGYPSPRVQYGEVHDRIDFVYAAGPSVTERSLIVGEDGPYTHLAVNPWPSDHRAVVSQFWVPAVAIDPFVSLNASVFRSGELVEVVYKGVDNGWVSIYPEGDSTPSQSQEVGPSGVVNFQEGLEPGRYLVILSGPEREPLAERAFRVVRTESVGIQLGEVQAYGTPVEISFEGGSGDPQSWMGIYPKGSTPGVARAYRWSYLSGASVGSLILGPESPGTTWPLPPGEYEVLLFRDEGYTVLARQAFRVR